MKRFTKIDLSFNNFYINIEIPCASEYSRKARGRYRGGIFDIIGTRSCRGHVGIIIESQVGSGAFQFVVRWIFGSIRRLVARLVEQRRG